MPKLFADPVFCWCKNVTGVHQVSVLKITTSYSSNRAELDMVWIHPWIGLDWFCKNGLTSNSVTEYTSDMAAVTIVDRMALLSSRV